jgi:hypothetical protein
MLVVAVGLDKFRHGGHFVDKFLARHLWSFEAILSKREKNTLERAQVFKFPKFSL